MKHSLCSPLRLAGVLAAGLIGTTFFVSSWMWNEGMLTWDRPVDVIEQLHEPAEVTGWDQRGLILKSGGIVPLPNCTKMPESSVALEQMTKRGVEITPEGRVIGLMRVWSFCGTCLPRERIDRIDIADTLYFLREGEWAIAASSSYELTISAPKVLNERGFELGSLQYCYSLHCLLERSRSEMVTGR